MGNKIKINHKQNLKASDIASFLGAKLFGSDIQIKTVKPLQDIAENALVFSKVNIDKDLFKKARHVCFITSHNPEDTGSNAFIVVDNPRLAFAKVLSEYFVEKKMPGIGKGSLIHHTVKIGKWVIIGNNCTIGQNVVIGDNTEIRDNVVIRDNVKIGEGCLIKSNTVIGEEGFGFEFEEDGTPVRLPHLGSVQIEDFVEIGACTTIAKGTLKDTIIHSYVKIDDHVFIAHNCDIGTKTMVIACAEISGSVTIGERCWLGPNCSIMNKVKIGDHNLIGLGAVVLKDTPAGAVLAGNPAKIIRIQE